MHVGQATYGPINGDGRTLSPAHPCRKIPWDRSESSQGRGASYPLRKTSWGNSWLPQVMGGQATLQKDSLF